MSGSNHEILLDSGTNELEIVTYSIGHSLFSINVMKVREIIQPIPITEIPDSHPAVEGVLQVRGEILPVINLAKCLNIKAGKENESSKFIITELNQMKVVFRVGEVYRIQRISWEQIEAPESLSMGLEDTTSGIVKIDEKIILMLDYEKLVHEISPNSKMTVAEVESMGAKNENRKDKAILVAEDSAMLRQLLKETLNAAGYGNITFFNNGKDTLEYIERVAKSSTKPITEAIDVLITDIEMPQMDGHHLTKRIKENEKTNELPIIIFSSLITEELRHKGEKVGANAQVSKPEIRKLIGYLDEFVL